MITLGEICWTKSKTTTSRVWQHFKTGVVRSDVKQKKKKKSTAQWKRDQYRK